MTDYKHELNRQRFATRAAGFAKGTSLISMNQAISMSSKHKDIISTTWNSSFTTSQSFDAVSAAEEARWLRLRQELHRASVQTGFQLLDIQVKAVSRIVKRPSSTLTVTHADPNVKVQKYRTPDSDVMSPVILDMPTGTGKTITSMLGAILFAIERRWDIVEKAVLSPTASGMVDVTGYSGWDHEETAATPTCIAFTPRHLVQHWLRHGELAKKIVEAMTFADGSKWEVCVLHNKKISTVSAGAGQVMLSVCDSSRCSVKKYLEPSVHYSAICFDEAGESDCKVNALCQTIVPNVRHGRTIMVSADFSKWRFDFEPRTASVFKHIFPAWNRYTISRAGIAGCKAASVFSSTERTAVMQECTRALQSAVVDIASVFYWPSLVERVGGGYGAELGDDRGCDAFFRKYGVCVADCSTVDEITVAIDGAIGRHHASLQEPVVTTLQSNRVLGMVNLLTTLRDKLSSIMQEECPICFERKPELKLIQPCLHFTCKSCMERISGKCPMCRGEMTGTVGITAELRRPDKKPRICTTESGADRIGSIVFDEIANLCGQTSPEGVMRAIQVTLSAIQNARKRSNRADKTLRTMLICPGANMREGLFTNLGFEVLHYKTFGTREDVVTLKRMNAVMDKFNADDGSSKLLCVRDASHACKKDSMTGLDIPNLDCVVSIGGANLAQRIGRLCRLSRMSLMDNEKHALYVDVVPKL